MAIVIKFSSITGIHRTKTSSHESIELHVEKDNSVPHIDPQCMMVVFPNSVQAELRNEVTWPKKKKNGRLEDQHVKDCLGKKVGNVPANFGGLFRKLIESRRVSRITCCSTGLKPQPSRRPPTTAKFRKSHNGGKDRRGGGLILHCKYYLHLNDEKFRPSVMDEVSSFLKDHDGDEEIEDVK